MHAFGSLWCLCTAVGILIGHKLPVASCSGTSFQINEAGTDLFLIIILLQETTSGSVSGNSEQCFFLRTETSLTSGLAVWDGELCSIHLCGALRPHPCEDRRMWLCV